MLKSKLRTVLNFLKLDLTKNLEYDRLTQLILNIVIRKESNCIDIGCHKGEILDQILRLAPKGKHFAFEPIPDFFQALTEKYQQKCTVYPYALSDENGSTTFNYVKNAPAYSGINKRKYEVDQPEIEQLNVEMRRLEELIPANVKIDLIKIDVEGAEFKVLKGAKNLIERDLPIIIFECGLGASDFYNTKPEELYQFIVDCGLQISTLKSWIKDKDSLDQADFVNLYQKNKEYYFIAHP